MPQHIAFCCVHPRWRYHVGQARRPSPPLRCAQAIFRTLERSGRLAEHENQQLYSEAAGKFLADRFVSGTCPYCAYEVLLPPSSWVQTAG